MLRDAPPYLLERDSAGLRRRTRSWTEEQLGRVHDEGFAKTFRKYCPVEGCVDRDYNQRILEITPAIRALVGIRFRGRDQNFPFVDLVACTAP